jgi:hypothetical protein
MTRATPFAISPGEGPVTTRSGSEPQSKLPRSIPLFRFVPARDEFSFRDWNPSLVLCADDLPPYLILGNLERSTFERCAGGWSARWQGTEADTHFDVAYVVDTDHWAARQTWRGIDGGCSFFRGCTPLETVIGRGLYAPFPHAWDDAAKSHVESSYQATVVGQQHGGRYAICGIPDGALRSIMFPVAVRNLRAMQRAIRTMVEASPLAYPITVEAKLVLQAVNYVEGKAPEWTTQELVAFTRSVTDSGLAPLCMPVRETNDDGTSAWTLRRYVYFVFIALPFAGLTDFLDRAANASGAIRRATDPDLRGELRPIVVPALFETQATSLALWNDARTTRSVLQFAKVDMEGAVTDFERFAEAERNDFAALAGIEALSDGIVAQVDRIWQSTTDGSAP